MIENERPTRIIDLPQYTQNFLIDLKEDEVEDLHEAMEFIKSIRTISRFFKWMIITLVAIFLSFISLWEGILKMKAWFR